MNILFLGAFPPEFIVKRSKGKIDSLYRASEALIEGLKIVSGVSVKVITAPDIIRYPKGPLYIKHEVDNKEGVTVVSILNLPFIKQWWIERTLFNEAKKYLHRVEGPVVVVIPYIVLHHVKVLTKLHDAFPKKVVRACVVPDIFFPKTTRARKANDEAERLASNFDCYILYTEKMAEKLNVASDKYVVIEGFRTIPDRAPIPACDFKVVYAGSLNLNYGIGRLVEAIKQIKDEDIHFHFYGEGNAVEKIENLCKIDKRVHFHGRVSNVEATDAIYSASVLINPRNSNDGEYTEYSFPSKDIEYMATGIPTLLCKLPGMPKEYYGHFVDMGEGSSAQIADAIMKVKRMSKEERNMIGKDSRTFIVERMNIQRQTKSIIELFEKML